MNRQALPPCGFTFNFEKLGSWHKAVDLANAIYAVTGLFPESERYGLVSQMRRASVSVASNLAEGASRTSPGDFACFIELATGSLYELVTQEVIANQQGYLAQSSLVEIRQRAGELTRMWSGLRRSLRTSSRHAAPRGVPNPDG